MSWVKRIFGGDRPATDMDSYSAAPIPDLSRIRSRTPSANLNQPHFRSTASLFEDSRADASRSSAAARAFLPSQPVSTMSRFAGREEVLNRVIRAIEDQHLHVIVYGDRGIGKTSLLLVVSELAQQANYAVHYSSCSEDSDFSEIFRSILSRIPLLYDSSLDPGVEEVELGGTLADKLPDGRISVPMLTDVLGTISGANVLIVLDEFDRASDPRFRKSVAELIKSLSDRAIPVQLLIGGVASSLPGLISDVPSIRRNVVGISLPNMNADEIRKFITIGEHRGGLPFTDGAIHRMVEVSAGLPYLAGLLAQYGTLAAISQGTSQVDERHITAAIASASEDVAGRLSPIAQRVFDDPYLCGHGAIVTRAAEESVRNGGIIRDPHTVAELAKDLGPVARLFERIPDDPWHSWRFVEDGASNLVWLKSRQLS